MTFTMSFMNTIQKGLTSNLFYVLKPANSVIKITF